MVIANLPVHQAQVIREVIAAVGARVVFLPPYPPDLSPSQLCWSKLKQCLHTAKARTFEQLNASLTHILTEQISADDAWGWFAHSGLLS